MSKNKDLINANTFVLINSILVRIIDIDKISCIVNTGMFQDKYIHLNLLTRQLFIFLLKIKNILLKNQH